MEPHPSDSQVQREAEALMLAWLSKSLELNLRPRRLQVGDHHIQIDGVSEDESVLVEAWAHQGPPKAAQKSKVINDAFKLLAAKRLLHEDTRMILLFADEGAARPFIRGTWRAAALLEAGIEVQIAVLPDPVRDQIRAAQVRQYR